MLDEKKFCDVLEEEQGFVEKPEDKEVFFRPACYLLIEHEGKILFIRDGRAGTLELPGGGQDIGETMQTAAEREVLEETGYKAKTTSDNPFMIIEESIYRSDKDKYFQCARMYFSGELIEKEAGEQNLNTEDEISEVLWFSLEEVKEGKGGKLDRKLMAVLDKFYG